MTNQKIIFYSVPEAIIAGSGPAVRVTNFSKAFVESGNKTIINGKPLNKLRLTFKAPKSLGLYIESSTNRIKIVDFICILILMHKTKKTTIYIRDIYTELFPEEYSSIRSRVTRIFNKLTNRFYSTIANTLAFPTLQMGETFYKHNKNFRIKPIIALPPGTTLHQKLKDISLEYLTNSRLKVIKIIYVGAISYKYAGIDKYLKVAKKYKQKYKFYIITNDTKIYPLLIKNGLTTKDIIIKALNSEQLLEFIIKENITFAIHSRPRNIYDDLTYPIKVMDYLSWLLPFITEEHIPIKKLLGRDYPLYWNVKDIDGFERVISKNSTKINYLFLLEFIKKKREDNLYKNRLTQLVSTLN